MEYLLMALDIYLVGVIVALVYFRIQAAQAGDLQAFGKYANFGDLFVIAVVGALSWLMPGAHFIRWITIVLGDIGFKKEYYLVIAKYSEFKNAVVLASLPEVDKYCEGYPDEYDIEPVRMTKRRFEKIKELEE